MLLLYLLKMPTSLQLYEKYVANLTPPPPPPTKYFGIFLQGAQVLINGGLTPLNPHNSRHTFS